MVAAAARASTTITPTRHLRAAIELLGAILVVRTAEQDDVVGRGRTADSVGLAVLELQESRLRAPVSIRAQERAALAVPSMDITAHLRGHVT
jgi:hypothetical protein